MGLDGVEIVMRTEETFGIEIPHEVAARLLTPAALVDFVAAHVPLTATEECLSQQVFYRLRRVDVVVQALTGQEHLLQAVLIAELDEARSRERRARRPSAVSPFGYVVGELVAVE